MSRARTILHADVDAFFAAVEVRENPRLRGRPVVIGADPRGGAGRGVVSAASYEARRFGIHSAMPISQAYRRCPHAVYLRPRLSLYSDVSGRLMNILRRYTDLVEPLSIDEAFLDVTGSRALFGDGAAIAQRIKEAVRDEQGLTVSVGVAPVKFVAKIASDLEKPDGLVVVPPEQVEPFLADLPIERLWGAGRRSVERLHRLGIRTIGDVARFSLSRLELELGPSHARHFHDLANGIDPRPVEPVHEEKSIGRETTFACDVRDRHSVRRTLLELTEEVARRLRGAGLAGRVVTVKLRTADFHTVTRRQTLSEPADTTERLWPAARDLLERADERPLPIRLIGISVSSFAENRQLSLFPPRPDDRQRRAAVAVDELRDRFGATVVRRGPPRE